MGTLVTGGLFAVMLVVLWQLVKVPTWEPDIPKGRQSPSVLYGMICVIGWLMVAALALLVLLGVIGILVFGLRQLF